MQNGNCKVLIAITQINKTIVLTIYHIILITIYEYLISQCQNTFFTGNIALRCYKNIIVQRSLSTVNTLRRVFQIEITVGTSLFTQSKTGMFIETTPNDQVHVFKEKKVIMRFESITVKIQKIR